MQASSICTPTVDHCATLFATLELSQKEWLVTLLSPDRKRMSRHRIAANDSVRLLALLDQNRTRAERVLGRLVAVVSCYEAGYDGFWLDRRLRAAGIENHVFDPASIAVDRRARRAKSDRIDGESMLRTLMAYCRGEPRVVRVVRVPSPVQEDARRGERERRRLIKERTAHINRIKGLLRSQGLAVGRPHRADWLTWFADQRNWQNEPVLPQLHAELVRQHARLMLVCEQVKTVEAARARTPHPMLAQQVAKLTRLKGIGLTFSTTLAGEVFWKDFNNRRQVASYVGLAASPWQSGGIMREQGISKAGNARARQTAVEMAWLWLRHQPDSKLSRWFHDRVNGAGGRLRKVMIVALARKLIIALWRYLTTGLVPDGAVFKA